MFSADLTEVDRSDAGIGQDYFSSKPPSGVMLKAMDYFVVHITYPILFAAVLARQLCLPIPAILFLVSAGALAGSGKLSWLGILIAAVAGGVLADYVWFEAGRLGGKRVLRLLCALTRDPSFCIRRGKTTFQKRGVRILLISKFVPGLDGIAPPLAGMFGSPTPTFIAYDTAGSALWAGAYITCGFFFAANLDKVVEHISDFANAVVLVFGIPLLVLLAWKVTALLREIRLLGSFQITPDQLKAKVDAGEKIGIVDLLRFEEDPQGIPGIPGAVRLDPLELRGKEQFHIPGNVTVVLYCRCKDRFASARVGLTMRKHGIQRVQVLEGGLESWKARGFPLSTEFANLLTELNRLGVEVHPPWQPLPAGR